MSLSSQTSTTIMTFSSRNDVSGKYGPAKTDEDDEEEQQGPHEHSTITDGLEQGTFVNMYDQREGREEHNNENDLLFGYTSKFTPGESPSVIKQALVMGLSAFVGAIVMILILGGRKTYNITEVSPTASSPLLSLHHQNNNSTTVEVMTATSLPFSIIYPAHSNRLDDSEANEELLQGFCYEALFHTNEFLEEKIKLYFLANFPQFQVADFRTVSDTCHNLTVTEAMGTYGLQNLRANMNIEIDFAADLTLYVLPQNQLMDAVNWAFFGYRLSGGYPFDAIREPYFFDKFLSYKMKDVPFFISDSNHVVEVYMFD